MGPTKFGLNYGTSKLHTANGELAPDLVRENNKWTGGIYQKLTDNLTILAEYSKVTAKAQDSGVPENTGKTFNIGAFLSF